MTDYTVHVHPAADAFPMMSDAELQELAEDIKANGLRTPLVFNHEGSILIDGRNRQRACEIAGIQPTTQNLPEGYTDQQIIDYIVSANVHRRHLTPGQKAMVATALEPMYAEAARERMLAGKAADPGLKSGQGVSDTGRSAEQAANAAGTSRDSVNKAKALKRDAPDLAAKVAKGEITLNAADRELKQRNAEPTPTRPTPAGPTPTTGAGVNPNPAPPTATAAPVDGDALDAEIAALQEKIRTRLWCIAAFKWWNHYGSGEPYSGPYEDEGRVTPAMIVVWQNAIDRGIAKPVTKEPNFSSFTVPDAPWPGLGLCERCPCAPRSWCGHGSDDYDYDWLAWNEVWLWCDTGGSMMTSQAKHLERLWVDREVARLVGLAGFFNKEGWFNYSHGLANPDDPTASSCADRNVTISATIKVPTPGHLFDELVFKVDRSAQGAVDSFGEDAADE